jgi:uncharacterized membrane protein
MMKGILRHVPTPAGRGMREESIVTLYHLTWLFFSYSFLGWVLETATAAVRQRRYVDRSLLFGPVCIIYGIAGTIITVGLQELKGELFFLFLLSAIYATVVEWIAGHALERFTHTRWWDYSNRKWNLDGYICLSASLVWGGLGLVLIKWGNPLLITLFDLIPAPASHIVLWVLLGILAVDLLGSLLTVAGLVHRLPAVEEAGSRLSELTLQMGLWILGHTERRIQKAYPQASFTREQKREKSQIFAQGCSFYKIILLFVIGAFLGDLVEMVFCRLTMGEWMSRSSLVWGPFSIVWGLAMALATLLLYRYKDRPASFLFVAGTFLGGAYEYLCSVFTEVVFGAVFWDYSHLPFNLGGRINLLYCFFWGFAAVAWFRCAYPLLSRWIEKLPMTMGKVLTWGIVLFMSCNIVVSCMALVRYDTRGAGQPAQSAWEEYMDQHYGDERMHQIYPKASRTD